MGPTRASFCKLPGITTEQKKVAQKAKNCVTIIFSVQKHWPRPKSSTGDRNWPAYDTQRIIPCLLVQQKSQFQIFDRPGVVGAVLQTAL